MTEYLILKEDEKEAGHWTVVGGDPNAVSAKAAIRDFLNGSGISESVSSPETFVAIPARSWQPVKVAVETALKFS